MEHEDSVSARTQLDAHRLLDCVADAIVVIDATGHLLFANATARSIVGDPAMARAAATDLVHPDDRDQVAADIVELVGRPGQGSTTAFRVRRGQEWMPVEAIATNLMDDPEVGGIVVSFRDLRDMVDGARTRSQLAAALAVLGDMLVLHDASGAVIEANRAARDFFALGDPLDTTAPALYPSPVLLRWPAADIEPADAVVSLETVLRGAGDRTIDAVVTITPSFGDDGRLSAVAVLAQDVGDRKLFETAMARQATHDPLTGLANRQALVDKLQTELARPGRRPGQLAVAHIDLDNFRLVNDSLGHDRGDQLLLAVTARLRSTMRAGDLLARIGADDFVAVLSLPEGLERARQVADRLTRTVSVPVPIGSRKVYVAASVGIAIDDDPFDRSPAALLRNAEIAMHTAKERGRNRVEVFDAAFRRAARARLELESELHQAIERGELTVAYQPVFEVGDGSLAGFEALVRWQHPRRGELVPADFIDVADDGGMITDTDTIVLIKACADLSEWTARFGAHPGLRVAVNVSPRQLAREDLPELIAATLAASGLEPGQLSLEIIEGRLMDDVPATLAMLDRIRSLGVGLAIDDFGTGHSSLGYLRQFDVDAIKIDRSFVASLGSDASSHVIIEAMVQLADTFGYSTVAEGVEDAAQLSALAELGCRRAQGFLLGSPMPAHEVGSFLERTLVPA